jgi:hypothetical protein
MKAIRRTAAALGVTVIIAGVVRLRGTGGVPPKRGGWKQLPPQALVDGETRPGAQTGG